ncbi:MAG: UbiA family prenyltransferase [Xanthobacteraceae bacterium]
MNCWRSLAQRFDFISFVIASDGKSNLKGAAKAAALRERFPDGFSYAGDSRSDLDVWPHAQPSCSPAPRHPSRKGARARQAGGGRVPAPAARPAWLGKALRVHQWAKNVLVFVPLVLGGMYADPAAWAKASLAFLGLGLIASATYLINDVWDIEDDRRHWTKRNRALASGLMTVKQAAITAPVMLVTGFVAGAFAGLPAIAVLFAYLALTLAYSFAFKRKPVLDAFTLAVLFTLRLVLGIVAVGVAASPWLLVFSMFLFTSLSFAKRQTEILRLAGKSDIKTAKLSGRGYFVSDAPFILGMGVSAGMASIVIMVLYLTQDAMRVRFYDDPVWLWGIPAFLFLWLSRIWMLCQRGELDDDPVVFAVRDPKSLILCAGVAFSFGMAWLGMPR